MIFKLTEFLLDCSLPTKGKMNMKCVKFGNFCWNMDHFLTMTATVQFIGTLIAIAEAVWSNITIHTASPHNTSNGSEMLQESNITGLVVLNSIMTLVPVSLLPVAFYHARSMNARRNTLTQARVKTFLKEISIFLVLQFIPCVALLVRILVVFINVQSRSTGQQEHNVNADDVIITCAFGVSFVAFFMMILYLFLTMYNKLVKTENTHEKLLEESWENEII
ncbi:uncharacterized protein LOC128209497 [Mya arenaria]|uniref:uncharacterized protein LOC128209497 n=1 Tax=Mya arenaria TaxID=6604 RepID=UPI0022E0D144|nr:uncharacterized protein LOC128209497 [Mya arenaria]